MAVKTANVTARVSPEIKQQAEQVLEQLGIPVSVLIDSLYRQIIMTKSIPYSLSVPTLKTLDSIPENELNEMLEKSIRQTENGQGYDARTAFKMISEEQ